MSVPVTIFVNEQSVPVPPGTSVRDAVAQFDDVLASGIDGAKVVVTDGVGLPVEADAAVEPGMILRAVWTARGAEKESR